MDNNFEQTVNLKEKMERQRRQAERKPLTAIEKLYQATDESETRKELQQISRPQLKQLNPARWRLVVFIFALIIVGVTMAWLFLGQKLSFIGWGKSQNWYVVTLKTNKEMYYGQIGDIKANPIELKNVYESYDQYNNKPSGNKGNATAEPGTLRLVKRSKELNGPSGNMLIYQTEIKTVDKLADDSKVLKAIVEYEK